MNDQARFYAMRPARARTGSDHAVTLALRVRPKRRAASFRGLNGKMAALAVF